MVMKSKEECIVLEPHFDKAAIRRRGAQVAGVCYSVGLGRQRFRMTQT